MDIFAGLNPAQKEAVEHTDGPLLIMAGAGSGKTKVLTCKVANLLAKGVAPWSILAITFTNKAATEMRERVDRMIGEGAKDVWLSTFHSFCAKFLRREVEATGMYKRNFVIYDSSDSQVVIKECLKELNLDPKQYAPSSIQNAISKVLTGRTSFIIAHRLSTVRNADRILVIQHGKITEDGTHRELIRKKGYYYNLYTNQFREEKEMETLGLQYSEIDE